MKTISIDQYNNYTVYVRQQIEYVIYDELTGHMIKTENGFDDVEECQNKALDIIDNLTVNNYDNI